MKKMVLNDLTLEKLISEINGYKDKMRTIYEEYGRASQDLQDRINVLGYTLNEHLKETKDQIGSTPQRLLNLETKYVTGEVSEQEYRGQREEFKGLLQRNLHSIEEIKDMIEVLTHIETRPLAPADFKQANPPAPRTLIEEWARNAVPQQAPATAQQAPAPTPTSPSVKFAASGIVSERPWAPPATPAAPVNVPISAPAPVTTLQVQEQAQPVSTITADPIVAAPAAPLTQTSAPAVEDSFTSAPAQEYVEDVADALVVKVVDDMPIVDASSAVATAETDIQPSIPGTEVVPGMPSGPSVGEQSLQLPSQFYKVVCPKCGADVPKAAKVWELKGGKSKKNVLIGLFQCQDCRVKFREALTRDII
ncbi:MAG TPA: CdvA-like protein [Candidatus Bathyarchaeia archaeon]|nr:CdvA-like protein [Candidatus Bathyarchaeia archaeon]